MNSIRKKKRPAYGKATTVPSATRKINGFLALMPRGIHAASFWLTVGSPMKKSDFHRSNRTPIQCMQAIDLYVKTTKRAMLTLSFLAEK